MQQQLFEQLRELIMSNRLRPGSRMPSSRMLAEQFAISRVTVLLTYERLIAEGFLDTRPSAGTFVAEARAGHQVAAISPTPCERLATSFPMRETRVGLPDPSLFPTVRWRSLMRSGLDRMGAHRASEHPAGIPALREAIASWLSSSRGLVVAPEQVMVMRGRQQALHLVGHLAGSAGQRIVVEDPCDPNAAAALADPSDLIRVPVDADGLRTDDLPDGPATLLYVTPEHQRPLGVALSHDRRIALLSWAEDSGAMVLEEDCEGELRYGAMSAPSLMSLDTGQRVILLGGFCASLGPWVDMAYLVLPRRLIAGALAARRLIDDSRSSLEQIALADFLAGGGYARHLHRLTKTYASRRDTLLRALRQVGGQDAVWGGQAGLHLVWFPRADIGAPSGLAALARHCGLEAATAPVGKSGTPLTTALLLGFGNLPERQIEPRIARFATLLPAETVRSAG